MGISGITTAGLSNYIKLSASSGSSDNSWKALGQSIAKGDLKTAQTLFTSYEKMISGSTSLSGGSQFATDLKTLSTALTKGDVKSAKTAYQTVTTDLNNNPALTMANTVAATKQAVQWMDDLLSLGKSSSSSSNSFDPSNYVLSAVFGYSPSSNYGDLMTSLLNTAYGTSNTTSTSADSSTDTSSSTTGTNVKTSA